MLLGYLQPQGPFFGSIVLLLLLSTKYLTFLSRVLAFKGFSGILSFNFRAICKSIYMYLVFGASYFYCK